MDNNRCKKCFGRLWGEPQHSADFVCTCPPEPKTNLMGWECPRCRTIHSPFVSTCGCPPPTITASTTHVPQWLIDHNANQ